MRVLSVVFALLFLAAVATAQAPSSQPVGTLAQVMRGILFPNSNLIFDVQSRDPAAPPEADSRGTVTSTFANIYTGWQVVENAAVALGEAANLITLPGRLCENGRPVPIEQDNWKEFVLGLREAGEIAYKAALNQSQEEAIDATNYVAEACSNCHSVYRDSYTDPPKERCVP